jgi:hypothetical protein
MSNLPAVDGRLLDAVAMCLCWAEHGEWGIPRRPPEETPQTYWSDMRPRARESFYRDAAPIALAMMSDQHYAVVPIDLSTPIMEAALACDGRWTTNMIPRIKTTYTAIVAAAREEMKWRKPMDLGDK